MENYPNLRLLRLRNNYKQEYVADVLGISQPEYSKLETGYRRLDAEVVCELCKLYDVTSDIILSRGASLSVRPGNAYVRDNHSSPTGIQERERTVSYSKDLLEKMLDNYKQLVESYIQQQNLQEEIIRLLVNKNNCDESNNNHN